MYFAAIFIALLAGILQHYSTAMEIRLPRQDQVALGSNETKFLYLNEFIIGESITIDVDVSRSNAKLINYDIYNPVKLDEPAIVMSFTSLITDAPEYIYGLTEDNLFVLVDKTNYENNQTLDLANITTPVRSCFAMGTFPKNESAIDFVIDCTLANKSQAFLILSFENNLLQYNQTMILPGNQSISCEKRALTNSDNYILRYCPYTGKLGLLDYAQVFTYQDRKIAYKTQIDETTFCLTESLIIKNITLAPQLYNLDQFVLFDRNAGVIPFLILKQDKQVTVQYGDALSIQYNDITFLGKRIQNNLKYEVEAHTDFLVASNNFVYEVTLKDLKFNIVNHYLFSINVKILAAALTDDYAIFLIKEKNQISAQAVERGTSLILFYETNLDASTSILSGAADEFNTVYLIEQNANTVSLRKIPFNTSIILMINCCNNDTIDFATTQTLMLTIKELNQDEWISAPLNLYVFPLNYTTPVEVDAYGPLHFLFSKTQLFSVNLNDLVAGPAISKVELSTIPGNLTIDLSTTSVFANQSIPDPANSSLFIVVEDFYSNSIFTDIFWEVEGEKLDIVSHRNMSNGRYLDVTQCEINDSVITGCSIIRGGLVDQGSTLQQVIYADDVLYMLLGNPTLIYYFADSFKSMNHSEISCNSISVNTQDSGNILCFTNDSICIFSTTHQKQFLGCPFTLSTGISQANDYLLEDQILFIADQTQVIRLQTTNHSTFDIIDTFEICSTSCNFEVYLWGKLSDLAMIIVNIDSNLISEYDVTIPNKAVFIRNYPQYGAKISSIQDFSKKKSNFIPLRMENCCLGVQNKTSLFIYNPKLETNKLLTILVSDFNEETHYYHQSGKNLETLVGLTDTTLTLYNYYKTPKLNFNITLDSQVLQEEMLINVTVNYSNFIDFMNPVPLYQKAFTVDCDFSNFFLSNSSDSSNNSLEFQGHASLEIRPTYVGPIENLNLECADSDIVCPYSLRTFIQKYYFFTSAYQTYALYGYPIKSRKLSDYIILLSQRTLTITKIGTGASESNTDVLTDYGDCLDLLVVDSVIYLLCQYPPLQSFSILIKEFGGPGMLDSAFTQINITYKFQEITKVKIINEFVFMLGNSTQTASINDISIYLMNKNQAVWSISHLTDFTNLFSGFSTFKIDTFDAFSILNKTLENGTSYIIGVFLVYSQNLFYGEINFTIMNDGSTQITPNVITNTNLNALFSRINEMGDFEYISVEGLTLSTNATSNWTVSQFDLLVGTLYNMYTITLTLDVTPSSQVTSILKGYLGCLNYYEDNPKRESGTRVNLCYTIDQNVTHGLPNKVFTMVIYSSKLNNITSTIDNNLVNISFPVTMLSSQIPSNTSSVFLYGMKDSTGTEETHVVFSNPFLQFEDYVVFDELRIYKNPSVQEFPENISINVIAYNEYDKQNFTIIALNTQDKVEERTVLVYILTFVTSLVFILVYFGLKFGKKKRTVKVRQQEVEDDDDDYSLIVRKSLMQ